MIKPLDIPVKINENKIDPLHILVLFGDDVPQEIQGTALMQLEKTLRTLSGLDCRVFKERMDDDSKLRRSMTPAEREKL